MAKGLQASRALRWFWYGIQEGHRRGHLVFGRWLHLPDRITNLPKPKRPA